MQIGRLGLGSAVAGGVLGVAAMVGVGVGVHELGANAQTPPAANPTAKADRGATQADYLAKLAANLGISVDTLKAANVKTIDQLIDAAQAAGKITADQATQAKARVQQDGGAHLGGVPFFGGHRGPGRPGVAPQGGAPQGGVRPGAFGLGNIMGAAATAAGVDQQTLMTKLKAGESLAQIAQENGVSRDQLKAALSAKISSNLDALIDRTFQMPPQRNAPAPTATPSS